MPAIRQLPLALQTRRTHGGKRKGAGRKKTRPGDRRPHVARKPLNPRHPIHVTVKLAPHVWSLRSKRAFTEVHRALRAFCQRRFTRFVGYSVQGNHIHLVGETAGAKELGVIMAAFCSLLARRLNRMMGTRGRVIDDRYDVQPLSTPRRVWNALVYVASNTVKHARERGVTVAAGFVDPYTWVGAWFDGPWSACGRGPPLAAAPGTWLLTRGWRRADPRR